MSDDSWSQAITAVSTLAAAGMGAWIVWLTTNRQLDSQRRAEAKGRFIQKMETLHEVLTKLDGRAALMQISILGKIGGSSSSINADDFSDPISCADVQMLVDFYAPPLKPEADEIEKGMNRLILSMTRAILETTPNEAAKNEIGGEALQGAAQVRSAVKAAKNKLRDLVPPHAAIPG